MQDSLKSNSLIIRIVSIFLAFLILLSVPAFVYASSILPTLVKIADYADVIIRLANSGLDAFKFFKDVKSEADVYAKEEGLINGMGRSDVVGSMSVTGFSCDMYARSPGKASIEKMNELDPKATIRLMHSLGVNDKVIITGCSKTSLYGYFFDVDGIFMRGVFTNPFNFESCKYLGVYSLSELNLNSSQLETSTSIGSRPIFYDKATAEAYPYYDTTYLFAFDWDSMSKFNYLLFCKYAANLTWNWPTSSNYVSVFPYYALYSNVGGTVTFDQSRLVVAAPEAEPETRPSSLMQAIHNYNVDNSYTDNSTTVNYFLAPKDQTPTADNVVSPAIFDEETWVFTEPATGAQYQSTGWTYDYNTRTYDIDLEAGTFTLDGTDVTRIVSQYGNELATITYYDASGNALATDEYNYVMMAASECALNGHTYNANTTKEPTCIASGERTYTCSVCGDQYVEEIAKTDHVYADHTITQEPTCTVGGISSKTCSTCGDQITEKLDPLGHDFIAKEITETTYELPPGTSCPSCSGTNYTFSRQGVIYTLLCSECNTEWTAEADVTYGSTTYVCSNCGESKVEGDATEETQETWFTKFIYKFKWLSSIGQIYRQLVADITSDAETAAAIADGTVMLDEVTTGHAELGGGSAGSEGSGRQYTAPELAVSFGDSDHYGVDWDAIKPLNLSWYAPHKETVDGIVSGILWLGFLFLLIKRAPSIIQGAEMITEDRIKIDFYNRR